MFTLCLRSLEVSAVIGVPEAERGRAQTLLMDVSLTLADSAAALRDDITLTADYDLIAQQIRQLTAAKPRKLLETLVWDLAHALLADLPPTITAITLTAHKPKAVARAQGAAVTLTLQRSSK